MFASQENYKQRHCITYIYRPAKIPANCPGKTTAKFNSNNVPIQVLNDVQILFSFVPVPFIYYRLSHNCPYALRYLLSGSSLPSSQGYLSTIPDASLLEERVNRPCLNLSVTRGAVFSSPTQFSSLAPLWAKGSPLNLATDPLPDKEAPPTCFLFWSFSAL